MISSCTQDTIRNYGRDLSSFRLLGRCYTTLLTHNVSCGLCLLPSATETGTKETLNMALKEAGSGHLGNGDAPLCGQTASVVIPQRESAETTRALRQLLLRFVFMCAHVRIFCSHGIDFT